VLILLALGVLQVTPVRVALADENTDAAKRLYESGTRHFDLGDFEAALNDFKEGYRHRDDPVFLYNIAQCYRLQNNNSEALRFYKTYLRRAPSAPNREEVERRIQTLNESIDAANRARQTPPQGTLPPGTAPGTTPPGTEPQSKQTPQSTTPQSPTPAPAAATSSPTPSVTASAPPKKTPVYKKWWLWTIVGVVAVGAGVGLGVGLSQSSNRTYPGVTF
jgi:tetratricopeptide (TPR) repeat protein